MTMCGRFRGDVVGRVFFIRGGLRRGCLVLGIQVSATGFGFLKSVQVVRDQERDRAVLAGSALLRSQTLLVADVSSPSVSNAASIVVSQPALAFGIAHGALVMTTPGDTSMATLAEVRRLAAGRSARVIR